MDFTNKEVKRAIREFERKVQNLVNAGHQIYQTRVSEFINLIKKNKIINLIVGPYFEIDINFKKIENERGGWFNLNLPDEEELQIAYIIQIMEMSSKGEFNIDMYAVNIFSHKSLDHNLSDWNQQILFPGLQLILDKLHDLVEDNVEGKEKISESKLNIINYGEIHAEQGNVAIGSSIKQNIGIGEVSKKIVKKALEEEIISREEVDKLKEVTDKIQKELNKDIPSKSNLQPLANSLYSIGKKSLLAISGKIINDPTWSDATAGFLMSLIS